MSGKKNNDDVSVVAFDATLQDKQKSLRSSKADLIGEAANIKAVVRGRTARPSGNRRGCSIRCNRRGDTGETQATACSRQPVCER